MKNWMLPILVLILFLGAADAHSHEYIWKRKKGKIALYCKPDKGKGYFLTDYSYDDNSISYWGKKKDKLYLISNITKIVPVYKNSQLGILSAGGAEVIPCVYRSIQWYRYWHADGEYFIVATKSDGKKELYHINKQYTVSRLIGNFDSIGLSKYGYGYSNKIDLKNEGKIGIVEWLSSKGCFNSVLPCEYTEFKLDSTMVYDLRNKNPKWTALKNNSDWMLLEKDGKYGIFHSYRFIVPVEYDLESFVAQEWTGRKGTKAKYLTKVMYTDRQNKNAEYLILQKDSMRYILDNKHKEVFSHPLRKKGFQGFDFMMSGLGDILYISSDNEKWFYRILEDSIQANCRGDLAAKHQFEVMHDTRNRYWLMENGNGLLGLYNSKTDKMILPAEYISIDLPKTLKEWFTVTHMNGSRFNAYITHDGEEVVLCKKPEELLKKATVVKTAGKYDILEYRGGYGIYDKENKEVMPINSSSIRTLGEVYPNAAPQFRDFLVTSRNGKVGLVSNKHLFTNIYDGISVTDTAVILTFRDWYNINQNNSGIRFCVQPEKMKSYIQHLKINSKGEEVVSNNILSTTLACGDDKTLREEIKTLAFLFRNDMLDLEYRMSLAGWNVKKGNYRTAIAQYQSLKGEPGIIDSYIDNLVVKLEDLQAQKDYQKRIEEEEREKERLIAEQRRQEEEFERQRRYLAQQRAAEAERQRKLEAWIKVAEAAGQMATEINNAVQTYAQQKNRYSRPANYNSNYNAKFNQEAANIDRAELSHALKYYNIWVGHAKNSIKQYLEADAKLKLPGIDRITMTNEQQRRSRARQSLKRELEMMRSYRQRAAKLGGNIQISQTELQVEVILE